MVGCFPALASANQGAVRPPGPPYTQPGRITSPRTPDACSTSCSCAGRHATSLMGFRGAVSSTMWSPVSPCTQTPLVRMRVFGFAPRRPASIRVSIAFLSLATPFAEYSKAAWTSTAHSAATSAYVLGSARSPTMGSISCCSSQRAFASVRVRPQTRCPARRNAVATLDPTYPVAPVTNTCIGQLQWRDACPTTALRATRFRLRAPGGCRPVHRMDLPQRAERGVAAPVLEGVRCTTAGRLLLMVPVVEGGARELDPNRWIDVAAWAQPGSVHEGGERAPSPAVDPAVGLRRNFGDDAGRHRRGCGLGQLDVPVTVALVEVHASHPAGDHEYAVLAPGARCTCVFAREALGRPLRQDLGDEHGSRRSSRERRGDLRAPAIVGFGAPLPVRRSREEEDPSQAETDGQTRHGTFAVHPRHSLLPTRVLRFQLPQLPRRCRTSGGALIAGREPRQLHLQPVA